MAYTTAQWQALIVAAKEADPVIGITGTNPLSSTSRVAIWYLWSWVIAAAMSVLGNFYDQHKLEVIAIILAGKAHTLNWYMMKAKAFQYGVGLPADTDVYAVVPPVTVKFILPLLAPKQPTLLVLVEADNALIG